MNLYNVLSNRYVGMSNFERLFAQKFVSGGKIKELEGVPPLTFTANGQPLLDYRIYGNTVQTGTPTPENPIVPSGCGERTENLFDEITLQNGYYGYYQSDYWVLTPENNYRSFKLNLEAGTYTLDITCDVSIRLLRVNNSIDGVNIIATDDRPYTFSLTRYATIYVSFRNGTTTNNFPNLKIMVTPGSTAPTSYIPYGYKLPILSNSTVTNIYLGEVETTRRIKKLVLTGEEAWSKGTYAFNSVITGMNSYKPVLCTHYQYYEGASSQAPTNSISTQSGAGTSIWIKTQNYDDTIIEQWKSYLAAQYANGTPVTVWYVLAEAETGIMNEPLMKIGDYTDTISMKQAGVSIPTAAGETIIDYNPSETSVVEPEKMYVKYKPQ